MTPWPALSKRVGIGALRNRSATGLGTVENVGLGELIREVGGAGTGVMLVDHDVSLVLAACDHVIVLDFGEVIARRPEEVRSDPVLAQGLYGRPIPEGAGGVLMTPRAVVKA